MAIIIQQLFLFIALMGMFSLASGTEVMVEEEGNVTAIHVEVDEPEPHPLDTFAEADVDNNGYLDEMEAERAGIVMFNQADKNGDNRLNPAEYRVEIATPEPPSVIE